MSDTWKAPGSRWWRFDLHAHSPKSYDFKDQLEEKADEMRRWLEAARDGGIEAIAVTDHNTAEAIGPIQDAASKMDAAPIVFPGVELTANDGCHLLLLMDPSCDQQHVDDLLSRVELPVSERGKRTARSHLSVEMILEKCGDDALVIGVENEDDAPRAAIRRAHQSLDRLIAEFWQSVAEGIAEVERQLTEIRAGSDANEWRTAVLGSGSRVRKYGSSTRGRRHIRSNRVRGLA